MTLLFFEGFETVGTELGIANQAITRPRIDLRFDATSSGSLPVTDSFFLIDDAFSEGQAIQMGENNFSSGNKLDWKQLPNTATGASASTYIVGFRAHIPSTSRSYSMVQVMTFANNSTHLHINVVNSADINVQRNLAGSPFFTGVGALTPGSWHYIELRFKIGNSPNGEVQLFVDGAEIGETLSTDTQDFFGNVDGVRFLNTSSGTTGSGDFTGYDDIYVLEVDATAPNDFLGAQSRVLSIPPNGDATPNDWTPDSGSAAHYTYIDENGADATDYLEESTNLGTEMFDTTDSTAHGQFVAVKIEVEAIAITTTTHTLDVRLDSNSSVVEANHAVTSTTAYDVFNHYQMTDPDTGSGWTKSAIDAVKVGMQFNT